MFERIFKFSAIFCKNTVLFSLYSVFKCICTSFCFLISAETAASLLITLSAIRFQIADVGDADFVNVLAHICMYQKIYTSACIQVTTRITCQTLKVTIVTAVYAILAEVVYI